MQPLTVFLGHLSYGHQGTDITFPLNIGYLKSYVKKHMGDRVDVRLFTDVDPLLAALDSQKPRVLGLSNYLWNSLLSDQVFQYTRRLYPSVITVSGGSNYSATAKHRERYWRPRKDFLEGEETFVQLLKEIEKIDPDAKRPELNMLGLDRWDFENDRLSPSMHRPRIKNIEAEIPSPILTGDLDEFIQMPIVQQTTRGCPFKCQFCHEGGEYWDMVYAFSLERSLEELEYIRARGNQHSVIELTDSNFGMLKKDIEFLSRLAESRKKTGWPSQLAVSPTKKINKRFAEAVVQSDGLLRASCAFQSTNDNTLAIIQRRHPREDEIALFKEHFSEGNYAFNSNTSLVIPMPEETYESYLSGMRTIIDDLGISEGNVWTLQAFAGNMFEDPEIIQRYGMQIRYRFGEGHFGEFAQFSSAEIEEVCIATNTFSEEEYYKARLVFFFCTVFYFKKNFFLLRHYLKQKGVGILDWILFLMDNVQSANPAARSFFQEFDRMTREELFGTREEIEAAWNDPEQRKLIIDGRIGYNVIQVSLGNLVEAYEDVLNFAGKATKQYLEKLCVAYGPELDEIILAMGYTRMSKFDETELNKDVRSKFEFDLHSWGREGFKKPLGEYHTKEGVALRFVLAPDQKEHLRGIVANLPTSDKVSRGKFYYRVWPELYNRKILAA